MARLLTVPHHSDEQMPAVQGQTDGRNGVALAMPADPSAKPAAVREVCGKINEHHMRGKTTGQARLQEQLTLGKS